MVERVIYKLKEQCIPRHRVETSQHASRAIADWTGFCNTRRPRQVLEIKTPAEAFALATLPVHIPLSYYIRAFTRLNMRSLSYI